jgi:PAS domain S-box-containing protein
MSVPPTLPAAEAPPSTSRSRQLIDGLAEGYVAFDADWRFIDCNAAAERLLNRTRHDLLGSRLSDVEGFSPESPFAAMAGRVAASRKPEDAELSYGGRGRARLLLVRAFPLGEGIGAAWRDITAARAAERRLALSEARHREIADGVPAAAWLSRANGKLEFINQAMADALGRPRRALLGDGWMASIDPEDRARLLAVRSEARARRSSFQYEARFRRPDGRLRIIQLFGRPRFDALGAFRGHIGIAADVTDMREHEERQRLLVNELNHRVKNTLATVQSLVRHTLRDHDVAAEIERAVTERLLALSAAHDVLSRENWKNAELTDIVAAVMRPYDHPDRVSTSGPRVRVSPKSAIALSMGLQELATNAAKHGALSSTGGRVQLNWTRNGETVALEWRERGGPPVTAPELSGFGALLLNRVLPGELGHPAEVIYAPEGVICRLRAPAAG